MNWLDGCVILIYLAGLLGLAAWLSRRQASLADYYLAGQKVRWWESGLSTMATQLGAISFVSAPAFVALAEGGGLKWLCYEFGVPLALIGVMWLIVPTFHRNRYISIYEYLEHRFDRQVRLLVSLLFQLGRGLATAVSVLAGGLILSTALPLSTEAAILVVGSITLVYAVLGGIRVVILSDALQMGVILLGILVCGGVALNLVGWEAAWAVLEPERRQILDFERLGLTSAGEYAFWPMTIGGIFLYASYYGCDQSQVQRELSVGSVSAVRKSLLVNAFGRFPLVLLYCVMGVLVGAVFSSPETLGQVAASTGQAPAEVAETLASDPDRMLPMFILSFLPNGLIGFLFIAILSALMSSLDSAINSLSAVTVRDVYQPYFRPNADQSHYLKVSRVCTALWGVFCMVAALAFAGFGEATRHTTIVLINAVGSLLYGPILAAFVLGMTTRGIGARAVVIGVFCGLGANLCFWLLTDISWLWWNFLGFGLTTATALLAAASLAAKPGRSIGLQLEVATTDTAPGWGPVYVGVGVYFLVIIGVCYWIQSRALVPVVT